MSLSLQSEPPAIAPATKQYVFEFYDNYTKLKDTNKMKGRCKTWKKEIKGPFY